MTDLIAYYKSCHAIAKDTLRRYGCNGDLFEDLYHEAFCTLMIKQSKGYKDIPINLKFIIGMCKNLWLKELRRLRKFEDSDDFEQYESGSEEFAFEDEKAALLHRQFENLPATCREVLKLHFEGYSEEMISEKLNLGGSRVAKNKKYYCRDKLLELMVNDPTYSELHG